MKLFLNFCLLVTPLHFLFADTMAPSPGLTQPTPISTPAASKAPVSIIVPIDSLLREIRDGNIEKAYYNTTSEEFKNATSLENFKEFVAKHPVLMKHHSIEVKVISIQDKEASITVTLNPNKDAIPINFLLTKENNIWKIWHLSVVPLYSEEIMALMKDPTSLQKPIQAQLAALKNDNILKAYQAYTSDQFKKMTSLDSYRAFLKDFPFFVKYNDIQFKEPILEKGTGLQEVNFHTDEVTVVVDYTLGIEEDEWKIWKIQVVKQIAKPSELPSQTSPPLNVRISQTKQPEAKDQSKGPMDIRNIEIGSRSSFNDGSSTKLTSLSQGDIYINLQVKNGLYGTIVKLELDHTESNTNIPPVSTTLEQDGNVEISFAFTPPPNGWPKGHYNLKINSSNGINKTIPFTID